MLECVINISEGRDAALIHRLGMSAGSSLLDIHSDIHHNRSVFTLAGGDIVANAVTLTRLAVGQLDLSLHLGVHPRIGIVDVVPFVPLGKDGLDHPVQLDEALTARNQFARTVSEELALPCFLYGPERSLPDLRKSAFLQLEPDFGPKTPHPRAGACCVGARGALIAFNVNICGVDTNATRRIARNIRRKELRALGLELGDTLQVSCNLIDPTALGIEKAYELIAREVKSLGGRVQGCELVGLLPERILSTIARERWEALGLSRESTIEFRLG
ncbi:MAG TPA: hypothetical protein VMU99_10430 [Acidimicrobiales bacterium]|nr:hypothetical protein [Acidimicrobiales bacterium]